MSKDTQIGRTRFELADLADERQTFKQALHDPVKVRASADRSLSTHRTPARTHTHTHTHTYMHMHMHRLRMRTRIKINRRVS